MSAQLHKVEDRSIFEIIEIAQLLIYYILELQSPPSLACGYVVGIMVSDHLYI